MVAAREKGLRLPHPHPADELSFESFPDSEGIKTSNTAKGLPSLIQKGLRRLGCAFPDSEGIKTSQCWQLQFESFPDSEGIKTSDVW